jgi:ureidoglycolate lyase
MICGWVGRSDAGKLSRMEALPSSALELIDATPDTIKPVGELLRPENLESTLAFPSRGTGRAMIRCARVFHREPEITWLERYMHLTQTFIGLGTKPFLMVLAPPNHVDGKDTPDVESARTYRIPAGLALLLHLGTWHEFPIAAEDEATVITMNSEELARETRAYETRDVAAWSGSRLVISYPD